MLSISFGEILLIATVGLVVIGPKRLPQAARFAGHLIGRIQRQVRSVKDDIKREMDAADLQNIQQEYQQAAKQAGESAGDIYQSIKQTAAQASGDINKTANHQTTNDDNNNNNNNIDNNKADNKNTTFPPPHTAPNPSTKQNHQQ